MSRHRLTTFRGLSTLAALLAAPLAHAEPPSETAPPAAAAEPTRDSATPAPRAASADSPCGSANDPTIPIGADFAPYVGTSSSTSARSATRSASFNLFGGYAGGLRGVELAGVMNLERRYACGVQVAGATNLVLGPVRGVALSGIFNLSGPASGASISGAVNLANGAVSGLELAGVANLANGPVEGAQISGGVNLARGALDGLQLSSALNLAPESATGAQIGGGVNLALGDVNGLQLAPVNVATRRVRGVQIGVVNVAEKSDLSLGIVSINTRGRTHIDAWSAPETGVFASAVKHGGDHWHGIYGFGARSEDGNFLAILGFGGRIRFGERLRLDIDALGYEAKPFRERFESSLLQGRALLGVRLLRELSIFAGPSYNVLLSRRGAEDAAPSYAREVGTGTEPRVHLWPGGVVGVEVLSDSAR